MFPRLLTTPKLFTNLSNITNIYFLCYKLQNNYGI